MVVKPQDELLASILNKGIDSLTEAERQAILQRWFNNAPSGLDPVQVLRWALTIGLPIFVGSLFVSYWIVRLRREIRERKRLQRKLDHLLEQTSSRLSGVMENSPAAIWAKDRSGRYLFANEAFRTFHRVPTDLSIVDRTDLELFDPGTAYAFRENDELVAASGNSIRVVEQIGFSEDAAHMPAAKFPLRGPTGEIEAIGGVAIDVTEQLRLQTRLSQVNQALVARENILLKLSSERIFDDGDMAAGFRAVTSAITAILEVQRASVWMLADAGETLVCQWLHDTVRGASDEAITLSRCDFEVYFAAIKGSRTLLAPDAHEDSRTACFSESYLRPHGIGAMLDVSIRHHGETVGVICCEHGPGRREWGDEDASFVGALADLLARALTARERQVALAQLQELNVTLEQCVKERTAEAEAARSAAETSRRRVIDITDSLPGVVYEVVRTGSVYRVLYVSDGIEMLCGVTREEVIADFGNFIEVVHSDDLPELLRVLDTSHREGDAVELTLRVSSGGGLERWVIIMARPKSLGEDSTAWHGFMADVTAQKRLERELSEARDTATTAERAKGDFLANMSHEIRTPMNAIIGMTHLALRTELTSKQHNYLSKIDNAAKALLGIVNDILDFSKIEAGKMGVEKVGFSLQSLFDNLTTLIGQKAQEKGLELLFAVAPDVPNGLAGDPLRIGQILTNFCSNAVKFTEHGEIVISVQMMARNGADVSLRFAVRDSGKIGRASCRKECRRLCRSRWSPYH
jgi:PAS domain S-box-containing protein